MNPSCAMAVAAERSHRPTPAGPVFRAITTYASCASSQEVAEPLLSDCLLKKNGRAPLTLVSSTR